MVGSSFADVERRGARKAKRGDLVGFPQKPSLQETVAGVTCGQALCPVEVHAAKAFVEQEANTCGQALCLELWVKNISNPKKKTTVFNKCEEMLGFPKH